MKGKKESAKEKAGKVAVSEAELFSEMTTPAEVKKFLTSLRDRMAEQTAAPIFAVSALNHLLNLPKIYQLLDNESKEVARDVWLRLKQSGLQLRNPPILFGDELDGPDARA